MLSLLCLNILLKKDARNSLLRIAEDILMDDSEPTEMGKMFFFSFLMCLCPLQPGSYLSLQAGTLIMRLKTSLVSS